MTKTVNKPEDTIMAGFSIGGIKVYPSTLKIVAGGKEQRLEPKVMDLLVYLARNPGEVISKEQILADVWDGVSVVEEALQRAISILRKTLGDDRENPKYIETISKKGYRLILHPKPIGKDNMLEIDYQKKTIKISPLVFLIGAALIVSLTYIIMNRGETDESNEPLVLKNAPLPPKDDD